MNSSTIFYFSALFLAVLGGNAVAAESNVEVIRNRVYVERPSGPLAMDIYLPQGKGPFPGILVVHGGGWTMGTRSQLAAIAFTLAKQGYTAAAVSYRLAPEHLFPAQLYDCQAAVRWLRQHAAELNIDPEHIGGYGYSAGGQLVALLGALDDDDIREDGLSKNAPSARLQAVVAGGAPCDFRALPAYNNRLTYWLGANRATKPEAYRIASPAAFVTADDPPMFFFHGDRDFLVPIESPQRMVELLTSSGLAAEMYTVQGRGHIAAVFDSEALRRALAFANRYLKPGQTEGDNAPVPSDVAAQRAGPSPAQSVKGGATDGE